MLLSLGFAAATPKEKPPVAVEDPAEEAKSPGVTPTSPFTAGLAAAGATPKAKPKGLAAVLLVNAKPWEAEELAAELLAPSLANSPGLGPALLAVAVPKLNPPGNDGCCSFAPEPPPLSGFEEPLPVKVTLEVRPEPNPEGGAAATLSLLAGPPN